MRELKFRAWDKADKLMYYDIQNGITLEDGSVYEFRNFIENNGEHDYHDWVVTQYANLLDKNGNKIYDGDIITMDEYPFISDGKPNYNAIVQQIYSQWQYILYAVNPDISGISEGINYGLNDYGYADGERTNFEVIGNIHENHELLNGFEL